MLTAIVMWFRSVGRLRDAAVVAEANRYMLQFALAGKIPTQDQVKHNFKTMSGTWSYRERILFLTICYELCERAEQLRDQGRFSSSRDAPDQFGPDQETKRSPSNR